MLEFKNKILGKENVLDLPVSNLHVYAQFILCIVPLWADILKLKGKFEKE